MNFSHATRNKYSIILFLAILFLSSPILAGGFTVKSTFSTPDPKVGDGVCGETNDPLTCTLHAAIQEANATPDTASTISFDIDPAMCHPDTGVCTITGLVHAIFAPVTIDGYTQKPCGDNPPPCSQPNTLTVGNDAVHLIELTGTELRFGTGSGMAPPMASVSGLVVNGNIGAGIGIGGNWNIVVEGCFIGTDPTGNVPAGNNGPGIQINSHLSMGDTIRIGGVAPSQRNVIGNGVYIINDGTSTIQGNYIGTNADGDAELGNSANGIYFGRSPNLNTGPTLIGGGTSTPGSGAGNVIAGSLFSGIFIDAMSFPEPIETFGPVTISGNLIGLTADGATVLGNGGNGIQIQRPPSLSSPSPVTTVTVGGDSSLYRNVIAGSLNGIFNSADGTVIQGNFIGTDITGTLDFGNQLYGIFVDDGHMAITGNIVANSGSVGIEVFRSQTTGVSIRGNSIYSNFYHGIDLGNDGVSLNDVGDFDTGTNNLQNFPLLSSATTDGVTTTIAGTLDSSGTFTLDFFANAACDTYGNGYPYGHGEGETLLGSTTMVSAGNTSFNVTLPVPVAVGQIITATATSAPSTAPTGDTSEFSACIMSVIPEPGALLSQLAAASTLLGLRARHRRVA
jgi:hypothetical protein